MLVAIILLILQASHSSEAPPVDEPITYSQAATMISKALELLQNNDRPQALKLLEKAFEKTQDPEELRQIGTLILEAAPANYKKREAYLRYLVKFQIDDPEQMSRWQFELADIYFNKGNLQEAEDWYLRAVEHYPDANTIRYKLAYVHWNLKRRNEAFLDFLSLYKTDDPSLKEQIRKDVGRLWWEMGPLPDNTWSRFQSLPPADQSIMASSLFQSTPTKRNPGPPEEELLLQIKSNEATKPLLRVAFVQGLFFPSHPCFLFNHILDPGDPYELSSLLSCLKDSRRPSVDRMLGFFEKRVSESEDERVEWAYAELLQEAGRSSQAIITLTKVPNLSSRSAKYFSFLLSLLLATPQLALQDLLQQLGPDLFRLIYSRTNSETLLLRLQAIDPDRWIPFEEGLIGENKKKATKSFYLKQGAWLAGKPETPIEDLEVIYKKISTPPLRSDEKRLVSERMHLASRITTTLPSTFSPKFVRAYEAWLSDVDRGLASLQEAPPEWQAICRPLFLEEAKINIQNLVSQLQRVELDPEMSELSETFDQRKRELRDEILNKYEFMKDPNR